MPIKIPNNLPAANTLEAENIFVMHEDRAYHQDIRPLKLLLLNLMPTKIVTETQLLRLLGNTSLQVEIDFLYTASYQPTNTSQDHLLKFYETFDQIKDRKYDGMIITGAPVEQMPFEEVDYWPELCRIFEWTKTNVYSTLHICWGAQAGLYYHYGIPKYDLPEKMFGVFSHYQTSDHPVKLFRGFDDVFPVPHSRHTEIKADDIRANPKLQLLAVSDEAGVYAVSALNGRQIFIMGHAEYDPLTLKGEYDRDALQGLSIKPPSHYFPDDDPTRMPIVTWRSTASLLFANWLNYYVYQETFYDLNQL